MKTYFLIPLLLFATIITANAQEVSKNAIGLRLGDSDGFGTEVSYQRGLSDNNRLELDLGWRSGDNYNAFRLTGLYQWVFNLDGNFNWFVGAGGGLAQVNIDNLPADVDDSETYLYAAGDIGIEYNFDIPLLLALDFRPEFGFGDFNDDVDFDIALAIRYQF
ncbi:MAG: porin family protein [Bacteroidetes bacterium]|nr:porin family protein [Bacteroidota bacterium]